MYVSNKGKGNHSGSRKLWLKKLTILNFINIFKIKLKYSFVKRNNNHDEELDLEESLDSLLDTYLSFKKYFFKGLGSSWSIFFLSFSY